MKYIMYYLLLIPLLIPIINNITQARRNKFDIGGGGRCEHSNQNQVSVTALPFDGWKMLFVANFIICTSYVYKLKSAILLNSTLIVF